MSPRDPVRRVFVRLGFAGYRLAAVDVYMLSGIAAGAVWLALTHLTATRTSVALMLSGLAALLVFAQCHTRYLRQQAAQDNGNSTSTPDQRTQP
ncbi:hypothetical protein [Actinomadura hibisca]|uniref:hypothetical protein n=1 Tax=Actinomadura hibisca TaxID=68565 RepID=UPI00082D1B97|nr:hypothetical protein [Actinomadura hibisca]